MFGGRILFRTQVYYSEIPVVHDPSDDLVDGDDAEGDGGVHREEEDVLQLAELVHVGEFDLKAIQSE